MGVNANLDLGAGGRLMYFLPSFFTSTISQSQISRKIKYGSLNFGRGRQPRSYTLVDAQTVLYFTNQKKVAGGIFRGFVTLAGLLACWLAPGWMLVGLLAGGGVAGLVLGWRPAGRY